MMILKDFKYLIILFFCSYFLIGQNVVDGFLFDSIFIAPVQNVQILNEGGDLLSYTDSIGYYSYNTVSDSLKVSFVKEGYSSVEKNIIFTNDSIRLDIMLLSNKRLKEVLISEKRNNTFDTGYLDDISTESNSIYSGKKSELIITDLKSGLSSNNARQMYNKTVSLNIVQSDDAGLQLNIGGRGLNPRRTSNFNVRQNNYEISADPLGYPESYYVPPFECLENIQVVRGAGALQYGTQFGGLINFNIKKPHRSKKIELITRNTIGSHALYTNFTSLSGTLDRFAYYTFFNHKKGDGFRYNSQFNLTNFYSFLSYKLTPKLNISFELTYLDYLAKQPGGLTDQMFYDDVFQSNRERNWFNVNWLLYNFQASYKFSNETNLLFNALVLDAHRYAIGFRTNRVNQPDVNTERDLIKAEFNNFGIETKLLHQYKILNKKMIFLIGTKMYSSNNLTSQGPGSDGVNANFNIQSSIYPYYESQSEYSNPNLNYSLFIENIIYLNKRMSLSPGVRFESIKTASDGQYNLINTDNAGNVILDSIIGVNQMRERSFLLFGLGYSFNISKSLEFYANCSQNYRAVTFSDINIVNPSFIINPNISDEDGYTFDFGIRGNYKDMVFYDISSFYLLYNNRIGFIQKEYNGAVKNEKGNVGDAKIYGYELLCNFNLNKVLKFKSDYKMNYFLNLSTIKSKYIQSQINGITGKEVEFVPDLNLKTGFEISFRNIRVNLQYIFLSTQFTDATNSVNSDLSGVIGEIPEYDILDVSFSYLLNNYTFELGVNNILDNHYFTNRATGYPGPGIIPSPTRNFYFTFEYKF